MPIKRIRVIPVLLLYDGGFYKTTRFRSLSYVGDPINTVKIFNEKGADEVVVLDIGLARGRPAINLKKISEIAGEAFMPMAYGGGIRTVDDAKAVLDAGFEKVIVSTSAFEQPRLITALANVLGSQSVVVCIDVKRTWWGSPRVQVAGGKKSTGESPVKFAKTVESLGAGELMVQSIDRDGTWGGYDLSVLKSVSDAVKVPVIACGGAASMVDCKRAVQEAGVSAVAAGSMFVYQKKGMGVLISFPPEGLVVEF